MNNKEFRFLHNYDKSAYWFERDYDIPIFKNAEYHLNNQFEDHNTNQLMEISPFNPRYQNLKHVPIWSAESNISELTSKWWIWELAQPSPIFQYEDNFESDLFVNHKYIDVKTLFSKNDSKESKSKINIFQLTYCNWFYS